MASQDPPASPRSSGSSGSSGSPARPAAAAAILLDCRTLDEIAKYIVDARRQANEAILSFPWPASEALDLAQRLDDRLVELGQRKVRRFEYDYKSGLVYLDIKGESEFHYQVQAGLRDYLKDGVAELLGTTQDATLRQRIRFFMERGPFLIKYEDKLCKQADGETRQRVEEKARQYIELSDGKIRAVLILDLQYKGMKKAWVSLLTADKSSSRWVQHSQLFHDDNLNQQPDGQVDLYLSDFFGSAGLPAAFCRPSAVELATGVPRSIVRRARHMHDPTKFSIEVGDEEEHPSETAARRVAETEQRVRHEERIEADRRAAETAAETERRVRREERIEAERRVAEVQRRLANMERRALAAELPQVNQTAVGQGM
ncbi:hypothetical protein C8A01DRAFT_49609 [Parachaetomium inaequale]|uniref:Uncharacterized protein n=1 Tax=Parachaetomium inaequale TaxID=2588326 RepID=A0AAN6P8U9_9PEZI|nr:hypothetical protein C8A01DRAFT_49609 [Parachaetomium inaequale]